MVTLTVGIFDVYIFAALCVHLNAASQLVLCMLNAVSAGIKEKVNEMKEKC